MDLESRGIFYYCVAKTKPQISSAVATKALISRAVTALLICGFVFAYADCWFSHSAAHIIFSVEKKTTRQHKTFLYFYSLKFNRKKTDYK